tara:strand:+ start:349 stop:585 length:237 start_codon:yes stop_codon:yes gene_type:complete
MRFIGAMENTINKTNPKLVDLNRLVEIIFDKQSAPSKRFLMAQKATGNLPHYKLGRRVFYDPSAVLNHITNSGKEVAQ